MKFLAWILMFLPLSLLAQVGVPSGVILVATAPSGACSAGVQGQLVTSTGAIWTCHGGTWAPVSGGGGGVGTVTSVGLTLPTSVFANSGSAVTTFGNVSDTFISQAANLFFGSPNGSAGVPAFRAIAAADIPTLNQNTIGTSGNTTAVNGAALPTPTPIVGGPSYVNNLGQVVNLVRIATAFFFGDSFQAAQGVLNQSYSMWGLMEQDIPAPVADVAISGTSSDVYAVQALNNWDPDGVFTNVMFVGGNENDGSCSSQTAACGLKYRLTNQFTYAWGAIPPANRQMASVATVTSGTATAYTSTNPIGYVATGFVGNLSLPTYTRQAQPGTAMSTTSSAVLTFTIPSSTTTTTIGISYGLLANSTSSFTATVDGNSVTDIASGTNTFSGAPQAAFNGTQTTGLARQEFSVSSASFHTVVLTLTGSGTYPMTIVSVDAATPNSPSNGKVIQIGTNPNATWLSSSFWNTYQQTLATQFLAEGLAVDQVDVVGGVTGEGITCTVNGTTDVSTTASLTYAASFVASHPNGGGGGGHEHYRQCILAAQDNMHAPNGTVGFHFAASKIVENTALSNWFVQSGPSLLYLPGTTAAASTITFTSGYVVISGTTPIVTMIPPPSCQTARSVCSVKVQLPSGASISNVGASYNGLQTSPIYADHNNMTVVLDYYNGFWYQEDLSSGIKQFLTTLSGTTVNVNVSNPQSILTLQGNTAFTANGLVSGASQTSQLRICQPGSGGPYTGSTFGATFNISSAVVAGINAMPASTCADLMLTNWNGTTVDVVNAVFGPNYVPAPATTYTIPSSATPALNVANGILQTITLSANATPTAVSPAIGQRVVYEICQPATGGPYTWTWPAAYHGGVTVGTTASTCSIQGFDSFNGTTFVSESAGVINVAP